MFADLKMHDIGNTVTRGVESVAKLGATFVTVHAYPQTMKGAVEGRGSASLKILAVTVLTSYNDDDLHAAGYRLSVSELVEARAAAGAGARRRRAGVLARGGRRLAQDRRPPDGLVTPGIRPAGSASGDQKRIMTPGRAIAAGADYLVVGRPVVEAADPKAIAEAIQAEIAQALGA